MHVVSLLELAMRKLLRGNVPLGAALEGWESLTFHFKALEQAANDLGAGLRAPLQLHVTSMPWEMANKSLHFQTCHIKPRHNGASNRCGAELYGPQDGSAVSSAADAVATCTELIVDELLEDGGLGQSHAEDEAGLPGTLCAAHDALEQRVLALVRAQGGGGADLSSEE